jgi:transaldolase
MAMEANERQGGKVGNNRLVALQSYGQSVWYDNISRDLIASGKLARLIAEDGVLGVTSNPTILERAISTGQLYDADIAALAAQGKSVLEIYEALAMADIGAAADLLRPVYDRTGGVDGYVSLEVSPHLAHDTARTIADARRLFAALGRPNIMIKVPATPEGIPAIRELIGSGINVNVTLIFALDVYDAVMGAYLAGLETLTARRGDPRRVASVASFFVSRVDAAVDRLLMGHPQEKTLRGKAAVANAKLAYARFQKTFAGPRWEALAARGGRVQRPLWASTSTKHSPDYPKTIYVDNLIGPHTVNTMPPVTLDAFREEGQLAQTITEGVPEAQAHLAQLAAIGIDMDRVAAGLLRDGVKAFADSFDQLLAGLKAKVAALVPV